MEGIHDGATRAAIASVMNTVRAVSKDQHNQAQNFRFRGIDDVLNAIGSAIRDNNLTVMPYVERIDHETRTTRTDKVISHYRVVVRYHLQVPHGEVMTAVSAGEAMDYGDKGLTKAMSVAYRTLWIQALVLPTGDRDPDHDVYEVEPAGQTYGPPVQARLRDDVVNPLRKEILRVLTSRKPPWTLEQIENDFRSRMGGEIREAVSEDLARYLELVKQ